LNRWGLENDIDMIAASFVRKPTDVIEIRTYCADIIRTLATQQQLQRTMPLIISKIESTEALENFDEILKISDAIMVARGDLAVEIPMETLAGVQKTIVSKCNAMAKPVIVATQMLETMQKNPRPTRAEITDVANAIHDGADSVMLSGESAKGKYPIGSVTMMHKIIQQTERQCCLETDLVRSNNNNHNNNHNSLVSKENSIWHGLAHAAVTLSHSLSSETIAGIIVDVPYTSQDLILNHELPTLISNYQPNVPIYVFVPTYKAGRRLQIYRGIQPILHTNSSQGITVIEVIQELQLQGKLPTEKSFVYVGDRLSAIKKMSIQVI
jgi:pyruvate kinase